MILPDRNGGTDRDRCVATQGIGRPSGTWIREGNRNTRHLRSGLPIRHPFGAKIPSFQFPYFNSLPASILSFWDD
jgi:hypothetical protein